MLANLRALYAKYHVITSQLIRYEKNCPAPGLYADKFGGLKGAFQAMFGDVVGRGGGAFLGLALYALLGIENTGDRLEAHPCLTGETGRPAVSGLHFRGRRWRVAAEPGADQATIEPL